MTADVSIAPDPRRRLLGRLMLIAVVSVFALPLVLANWIFHHPEAWTPTRFTNHGELIDPARPIEEFALVTAEGERFTLEQLHNRWTLLYVGDGVCDLYCGAALFKTRQVRLALGHDIDRVQRVYLLTDANAVHALEPVRAEHPGLKLGTGSAPALSPLLGLLGPDAEDQVYLVDPHGNVVLRYGAEASSRGMLNDLKKLLKNSRIG
jgi:cytochrome oxidase Cu insertion factor (SCO1/SenC/PrrC family)